MSFNLGPQAFEAISALKSTEPWRVFKNALYEHVVKMGNAAVEMGTPDACGYARGLRDVIWSIEMVEAGPGQGAVAARKKPDIIGHLPLERKANG